MYRILTASKDTYITNKYIASSRSLNANVGQAGTLDLFKLFDETILVGNTSSIVELSRLLIQFDYSELRALTASFLDFSDSTFKCHMKLVDVYGGQTVPSNFTLSVFPLSKSWEEGRGMDVIAYRDVDSANFISASVSPTLVTWSQQGAGASGSLGEDCDILVSGNLGSGLQSLGLQASFDRGDEDMLVDISSLVSASLAGIIENNGFRVSFIDTEEQDATTRFVKRFGSRHTRNKSLRPKLIVTFSDALNDAGHYPKFDMSQSLFTYNSIQGGNYRNFFSGSSEITGNDCLLLELAASKSVSSTTSSWSPSHSASITITTSSVVYVSRSFSGSQATIGSIGQTGIYTANVNLSLVEDTELNSFVGSNTSIPFKATWKSIDGTVTYATNFLRFEKILGGFSNAQDQNIIVNVTNLKDIYHTDSVARLRVFAMDYSKDSTSYKVPAALHSIVYSDMRWRLIKAFTKDVVIPFDEATKMSTDQEGMYFDLYMKDLDVNEVYDLDFLIKNDTGKDIFITNNAFRFKVKN